ncbi:hypothetical protein [Actinoallomurus acaciae]|uniref:Uncharacterized protein n=1 Tax=Actinoallomurus acaciae TaxID=502577 RepID=A0ABV5Y9D2_9ACTN
MWTRATRRRVCGSPCCSAGPEAEPRERVDAGEAERITVKLAAGYERGAYEWVRATPYR